MSLIPWSGKPEIDELDESDTFMRRTPSRAVKNQEIPVTMGGPSLAEYGMHTGVRQGLELSATLFGTTFDIAAGRGIMVNAEPDPRATTVSQVPFAETLGITDLFLTDTFTYIFLNSIGAVIQRVTPPSTLDDLNNLIFLGKLRHFASQIVTVDNNPVMAHGSSLGHVAKLLFNGGTKLNGAQLTPNGANLQLDVSAGLLEQNGRGRTTNENNPNIYISSAQVPVPAATFFKAFVDGVGELILDNSNNLLDPTMFNDGALGTLVAVGNNQFTNIRVVEAAESEALVFYYGTEEFGTLVDAEVAPEPTFTEHPDTIELSPLAIITIKREVADLAAGIAAGTAAIRLISHRD